MAFGIHGIHPDLREKYYKYMSLKCGCVISAGLKCGRRMTMKKTAIELEHKKKSYELQSKKKLKRAIFALVFPIHT